jgi:hypothetical protein
MTTKATTKTKKASKATRKAAPRKVKRTPAKVTPAQVIDYRNLFSGAAAFARAQAQRAGGTDGRSHEAFIQAIRKLAVARLPKDSPERARLEKAKLVYGMGMPGLRGVTVYGTWQNGGTDDFIEICAAGEESATQLAGTTIHELAHSLAQYGAGHSKKWKEACATLGLRCAKAAGHQYTLASFCPTIRHAIAALAVSDGLPMFGATRLGLVKPRPCTLGFGTRGGTSRGAGSGSRLRKYVCGGECKQIIRAATDELQATHDKCGTAFTLDAPAVSTKAGALALVAAVLGGGN